MRIAYFLILKLLLLVATASAVDLYNETINRVESDDEERANKLNRKFDYNPYSYDDQIIKSIEAKLEANTLDVQILKKEIKRLNSILHIDGPKTEQLVEEMALNCMSFEGSSSVHDIHIPGLGTVSVLCDAQTAESGWIVIQRRFNGSVDFYKNWEEYRTGFGDLDGEFFIGLEKLHRLTKSLPYELYIELTDFGDNIRYARYDNFLIGSEEEQYMLKSLGTYTGNAGNALNYNLHDSFTTYDRDNDGWGGGNCAVWYKSGWWYNLYGNSNLNGKYFKCETMNEESIWWYNWKGYYALQSVKMMIRPKYTLL